MSDEDMIYPAQKDIMNIHKDIVSEDEDASKGVINKGDIDFATNYIQHGHFGRCPETIHEKAVHLMRLLAANHSFADGNKRTALNTTWVFYFINDYYFDYGEEIKAILKLFAVMEKMVDVKEAKQYFSEIATPIEDAEVAESDEILVLNKLAENALQITTKIEKEINSDEVDAEKVESLLYEARDYMDKSAEIVEQRSEAVSPEFWNVIDKLEEKVDEIQTELVGEKE